MGISAIAMTYRWRQTGSVLMAAVGDNWRTRYWPVTSPPFAEFAVQNGRARQFGLTELYRGLRVYSN